MKLHFLVTIEADERTGFNCNPPEDFPSQIKSYVTKLVRFHTRGSVPAVEVKVAPPCFEEQRNA